MIEHREEKLNFRMFNNSAQNLLVGLKRVQLCSEHPIILTYLDKSINIISDVYDVMENKRGAQKFK